jgi:nucleolar protein 53
MGKKLQGAKLRAKKRAQEAVNLLQEAQAEDVAASGVVAKPDELLFVLDSTGDNQSRLYKNAIATGAITNNKRRKFNDGAGAADATKESSRKTSKPSSSVDEALVQKLLTKNKHDAGVLKQMAKRGKEVLERQSQAKGGKARKRLHQTTSRVTYDLWASNDNIGGGRPSKPAPAVGPPATATSSSSSSSNKKARVETAAATSSSSTGKELVELLASKPIAGLSVPHVPVKARTYAVATRAYSSTAVAAAATPDSANAEAVVPVEVATGGQSYHPDPVLHTKQLEVALQVEQRRIVAVEQKERPLATGLSEETKKYIVGDDTDTDDDDDDDDRGEDEGASALLVAKKMEKLTTAQRHKQKRLRREQDEINKRKKSKQRAHQLSEIPKFKKELNKQEQQLRERKEQLHALKESQKRVPGTNVEVVLSEKDPIQAPTIPVALPSEIGRGGGGSSKGSKAGATASASLRTIRPKGSLVLDRVHSMVDRNMAPAKNRRAPAPKKRKIKVQGKVVGPGFEIKG